MNHETLTSPLFTSAFKKCKWFSNFQEDSSECKVYKALFPSSDQPCKECSLSLKKTSSTNFKVIIILWPWMKSQIPTKLLKVNVQSTSHFMLSSLSQNNVLNAYFIKENSNLAF